MAPLAALPWLAASAARASAPTAAAAPGLTLSVYNNTAAAGPPVSTSSLPSPAAVFAQSGPFSAEITGTLVAPSGSSAQTAATATLTYTFECDFGAATLGLLHVDSHCVCSSGTNSPSGTTITLDQPLPVLAKTRLPFHLSAVFNGSHPSPFVNVTVRSSTPQPQPEVGSQQGPRREEGQQAQQAAGPEQQAGAQCTDFLPDTDFPGNDLRGVHHVPSKEACCALCANDTRCAGGSWDGPDSPWSDKTCNLKHATSNATRHPAKGMYAFTVRAPVPAPPPPPTPPPDPTPRPGPPGPPVVFAPELPPLELQRRAMQSGLAEGWGLVSADACLLKGLSLSED